MSWNDKPTEKQLALIAELHEFSETPLPKFNGTTRKDASVYIDTWIGVTHKRLVNQYEDR